MNRTARALAFAALGVGLAGSALALPRQDDPNWRLRREITSLNLVNGLYLSNEQLGQYVDVLERLKALQDRLESEVKPGLVERQRSALTALRDDLAGGQAVSEDVNREAHLANEEGKRVVEEAMRQLRGFEDEVRAILTENQLSIAEKFRPCIVPPKWLSDPARVGQASGDSSGVARMLERVREVPEERYERAKDRIVERYIDKKEEHLGEMSEDEKAVEKALFFEVLEEARSASQVDFEMKKQALAEKLVPEDAAEPHGPGKYRLTVLGRTLLNPDLIPTIKSRLASGTGN